MKTSPVKSSLLLLRALSAVGLISLIVATPAVRYAGAATKDTSYWLQLGRGQQKIECPGETAGLPARVSNSAESWAQVTGVVTCTDTGNSYTYDVNFLAVEINPEQRVNIGREALVFDWMGLAVYGPDGKGGIDWLYDEVLPIRGTLSKQGNEKIYFGNLRFSILKEKLARADHFILYLTAQGALISVYAL